MHKESNHEYFKQLNQTLKKHHRAIPFLLIDLDKVDENIDSFKSNLNPNAHPRIVVKSLPSPKLILYIADKLDTNRFMVFHQPFLSALTGILNKQADILLGKPMPVKTAAYFYNNISVKTAEFNPFTQIQWLIDTKERAFQYIQLAEELNHPLRLNLEIDVGLHRGGFQNLTALNEVLELISNNRNKVELSGLMGYDPHIVKIPSIIRTSKKSLSASNNFYEACKTYIKKHFPQLWNNTLTFNGAGSPTINLHNTPSSPLNDIAAGSCFVKPTTFDISTLTQYKAASFIATPILKKMEGTNIPGLENVKTLLKFVDKKNAYSFFIYGGNWKADYCYPDQIKQNSLYGESTNQTMVNAPKTSNLNIDDFVFLRPHQSEFVFLQFGRLIIIRNMKIIDEWKVFNEN